MLKTFGPEIWTADGEEVTVAGFHYPTRMCIVRLADGGLFVWSPIAPGIELRAAIDLLGPVRYVVAPNSLHHLSIPAWKSAYPQAKVLAAPGLRKKRKDIAFDDDLGDRPEPDWADDIDQLLMAGNTITTEAIFFHWKSGTVLFTDILQQFPDGWFSGWRRWVAKLDLMVSPEPSVPRKFRVTFRDKRAARIALKRILAWPTQKVLMAHGAPVTTDGKAFLVRAFRWLGT